MGKANNRMAERRRKSGRFSFSCCCGNSRITTEQAVRRLERLGYTIEDECIQKAVQYMSDCLVGKKTILDRVEKVHDWRDINVKRNTNIRKSSCNQG